MQDSDGPVAEWHLWLERLKFLRAGDGDRTRDKSLEGSHVTATPHPQCGTYMREEVVVVSLNAQVTIITWWMHDCQQVRQDSNLQSTA